MSYFKYATQRGPAFSPERSGKTSRVEESVDGCSISHEINLSINSSESAPYAFKKQTDVCESNCHPIINPKTSFEMIDQEEIAGASYELKSCFRSISNIM